MTPLSSLGNSPLDDLYKNSGGVGASRALLRKEGQVPRSPYLRPGVRSLAGAGGSGPGAAGGGSTAASQRCSSARRARCPSGAGSPLPGKREPLAARRGCSSVALIACKRVFFGVGGRNNIRFPCVTTLRRSTAVKTSCAAVSGVKCALPSRVRLGDLKGKFETLA